MNAQLSPTPDPFFQFKQAQKQGWAHFSPLEAVTIPQAPRLIRHARVRAGDRVLDVGCGTGVVSITAARLGAHATGLDLTPELLQRARENARISEVAVEFHEGDAEALPFADSSFDVVLSQFGHIFAPRPEVAVAEMLRVLKPGGRIAFSSWPPEMFVGRMFALAARYLPPPPPGAQPPALWGDPNIVRERLGAAVTDLAFERDVLVLPALSPRHVLALWEATVAPLARAVSLLQNEPAKLAELRGVFE